MKKMEKPLLRIRIVFGEGRGMLGPGKVELLEQIADTGSIAAAGRKLGMSYKRAWSLVEVMNGMFAKPVVSSARGGAQHGGADLTATGKDVVTIYRQLLSKTEKSGAEDIAKLEKLLKKKGKGLNSQ